MTAIAPFEESDLPERETSLWKMTGPGAVMVGLAIGSGEMVLWPWITAKFGASMAWAAVLAIFLQMWVNFEIGRWAVATGESAFTGFARLSRAFIYIFIGILFALSWLPGWARATAVCIRYIIFGLEGPGTDWQWTIIVLGIVAIVLFGPKRIYATVERVIAVMIVVVVLGMVAVTFQLGSLSHVGELGRGLVNFGDIRLDDELTFMRFFGATVFVGAGGFGQLFYAYYLRDKGIGMGAQIPELTSALWDKGESHTEIGFRYRETDTNAWRFRDWFRYVLLDNVFFFFLLNTFVTLLFMFGSLAVFHSNGIVPSEGDIIWDLSQILASTMGAFGHYLFLVIALCAMFSTQLAVTDGGNRIWTDILRTNFGFARKYTTSQCYLGLFVFFAVIAVFSTWFFETFDVGVLDFFFISAVLNGIGMAIWIPLVLYMNLTMLPKSAKPRALNIIMVSLAGLFYLSLAVYTCWLELAALFGGT